MFIIFISCLALLVTDSINAVTLIHVRATNQVELLIIPYVEDYIDALIITFPSQYVIELTDSATCYSLTCQITSLSVNQIQVTFTPAKVFSIRIQFILPLYLDYSNSLLSTINLFSNGNQVQYYTDPIQFYLPFFLYNSYQYLSQFTYTKTELVINMTSFCNIQKGTSIQFSIEELQLGDEKLVFYCNSDLLTYSQSDNIFTVNLLPEEYPAGFQFIFRIVNIYTKFSQSLYTKFSFYPLYQQNTKTGSGTAFFDESFPIPGQPNIIQVQSSNLITDQISMLSFQIQPRLKYTLNSDLIITFSNLQKFDQSKYCYNLVSNANFIPISNINPSYILELSNNCVTVKQFNLKDDKSIIEFTLDLIRNPIGLESFNIDITVQEQTKSLMEQAFIQLQIQPSLITNFQVTVENTTVFAQTNINLSFHIEGRQSVYSIIQLIVPTQILPGSATITPSSFESIKIIDQNIIIQQCFYQDQNIQEFQIQLFGTLSDTTGQTDQFQLFTYDANTNVKISTLNELQSITINESTFQLISFTPNDLVTGYYTTYNILFLIPEIKQNSVFKLILPSYYADQLNYCSAIIQDQPCLCDITSGIISILINNGGMLHINLLNIKTERLVKQYQYDLDAIIYNAGIIHSKLLNGQFTFTLITPLSLYDYSLSISNLYYGKVAQYQFDFNVHNTIYNTDILEINIPESITQIIDCNLDIQQQHNKWFTTSVSQGQNSIQCEFINPLNDDPIFPFQLSIFSKEGYLVAYYEDKFGIQNSLISNNLDFSITHSSFYLNDLINLSISYDSNFGIQRFGSLSLLLDSTIYIPQNLQCYDLLEKNSELLQNMACESNMNSTQTTISSTAKNSINIGNNSLIFTGLQLGTLYTGLFNAKFALLNINQFGAIIESSSIQQNIQLQCMDKCLACSIYFNNCTKCVDNYVLYGSICLSSCPTGMIVSKDKRCLSCMTDKSCNLCNSDDLSKCITCNSGYDLINGYCVRSQTVIQQNSTIDNSSNNTQSSGNQTPMQTTHQINQLYDGIPFIIITMAVLLTITLSQKILQQKKLIKQFFLYSCLIDIPVIILRLIRFSIIQDQLYSYLSTSCFALAVLTQVSNSFRLEFTINKKKNEVQVQGKMMKTQLMLLYSWRMIIDYPQTEFSENLFKKNIKVQILSNIAPIIIMTTYMIKEMTFFMFALDDILYNVIMIILQLTYQKWMPSTSNQIYPCDESQRGNKKYSNISVEPIREAL